VIRRSNWERRLAVYLDGHRGAVFRYGRLDCALFAAGAVKAMTGKDPARGFRSKYRSQASAVRAIRAAGFEDLAAVVSSKFEAIAPAFARRGDLVMDRDGSLGVCVGREALFVGEEGGLAGLVRQPISAWAKAWRVAFG